MIYGYIRVSHDRQKRSGLGLAAQQRKIEQFAKTLRGHKLARIFADKAVSARRHPLLKRPQGWQLDQALQAGDHVVMARLDRAFRNLRDFAEMAARWKKQGVFLHLLDVGVDTDSPVGELVCGIMAVIAQWESQRIGERIRDAFAEVRARGRATNGVAPLGYRLRGKRLLPDPIARKTFALVARLRMNRSWKVLAVELNRRGVKRPGGGKWNYQACIRAVVAHGAKYRRR